MRYSGDDFPLFNRGDSFELQQSRRAEFERAIDGLERNRILNSSVEDLCSYFEEKFSLPAPRLRMDEAVADQREGQVRVWDEWEQRPMSVTGTIVELTIPFDGHPDLFYIRPSTSTSMLPRGEVRVQTLTLRVSGRDLQPDRVKRDLDSQVADLTQYLDWLRRDLDAFNATIRQQAKTRIEQRRAKLLADQSLLANLGFPLRKREDAPKTYSAPVQRRKIEPRLPPASTAPFKPEPVLVESEYSNILDVLTNMALVMERSPSAFTTIDEEDLRQHFLVQLNGLYEGQATGETFNFQGKTDVMIRVDGRNIFIAECKYWRGEKGYLETIDQILSYLSWRDTKAAIVIFNRNKGFTEVLAKIQGATKAHLLWKAGPVVQGETRFRYVFGQKDDPAREVTLTVLAFDVPNAAA